MIKKFDGEAWGLVVGPDIESMKLGTVHTGEGAYHSARAEADSAVGQHVLLIKIFLSTDGVLPPEKRGRVYDWFSPSRPQRRSTDPIQAEYARILGRERVARRVNQTNQWALLTPEAIPIGETMLRTWDDLVGLYLQDPGNATPAEPMNHASPTDDTTEDNIDIPFEF